MGEYESPPPPKERSTKKHFVLVIIIMAIVVILIVGFVLSTSQFQNVIPVSAPPLTPIPEFSLVLSTSTPTIDIPVHQQATEFTLTLTKNGNGNLQFPCTVNIGSNSNAYNSYLNLIGDNQVMNDYGVYHYSIDSWTASVAGFEGKNVTFYATVKDTYGITVTSNSVIVEYYGNGLSPND